MKTLSQTALLALAALTFSFASCDSKPAEDAEQATEETMDAAGAEIDSAMTPSEGDTAVVKDQPVQDGLIDSAGTH